MSVACRWAIIVLGVLVHADGFSGVSANAAESANAADNLLTLQARSRHETAPGTGRWHSTTSPLTWKSSETAIVICDMWDRHWCAPSSARVAEMAPVMNCVITAARHQGVLIIHCPSDTMDFYRDTPQRKRAQAAPVVQTEVPLERWCHPDPAKEASPLPIDDSDGGCDSLVPVQSRRVWTRQHPDIRIFEKDAITDSAEAFYLMRQRGIKNVIVMGVHTNMCVLGRPFSIRQMVNQGQQVVLMRDLTDAMYNPQQPPYVSHFTGTDLVVEHIEQYWCPTVTSSEFISGQPFQFADDRRPHLVIVCSEPEYETEVTLTDFARRHLGREFRVSFVYGDARKPDHLPGVDVLKTADLALLSIRRRTLPAAQLQVFRDYAASGKPIMAIRTSSHAFCLRNQAAPDGLTDWPEFDRDVIGGSYTNHWGSGPQTRVATADVSVIDHPVLQGIDPEQLVGYGSLYKVSPLQPTAVPLLIGSIPDTPSEPVAWINRRADGGTTFYTSFGHKDDFQDPQFNQLLLNTARWLARMQAGTAAQ